MTIPQRFNTISFRISALVAFVCFILVAVMVTRTILALEESDISAAKENTLSIGRDYAGRFKSEIEKAIVISNTLANSFGSNATNKGLVSREVGNTILKDVLANNSNLLGTWTVWEPNAFDDRDAEFANTKSHDATGRFIPYWVRSGDGFSCDPVVNYEVEGDGDFYLLARKNKREIVFGPFKYPVDGKEIMMLSMITPIVKNNTFFGITGTDISVDWVQNWVDKIDLYQGTGKVTLVSSDGTVVATSGNKNAAGKHIDSLKLLSKSLAIKPNQAENFIENDLLISHVPMFLGKSELPWQVYFTVPIKVLIETAQVEMIKQIFTGFIFLIIMVILIIYLTSKLINPIKKMTKVAANVAVGDLTYNYVEANTVEMQQLNQAFEKVVLSQKDITEVCTSIAKGDFSKKANVKSEKDELSKAVNTMIDNLKNAAEEDRKRSWTTEGMAKFGDILRSDKDLKKLSDVLMSNLVSYLDCNQGWLFILNDTDKDHHYLELLSCFAYDRQKFIDKKIEIGEGLTGQAVLEKATIYITDIPSGYTTINSGLGEATPNSIVIVPLIVNEKIEGVVELASFEIFEPYQIEFIERLAESIAASISSVKINDRTSQLLEISQQQTEEMRSQEEEMRQNMEELQATQEEMERKESDYVQEINLLKQELEEYKQKMRDK